jgi:hypothetical protein
LRRVLKLDFATRAGYTVTLDDVDTEVFTAHQVLIEERDRYQEEQARQTTVMPPPRWSKVD